MLFIVDEASVLIETSWNVKTIGLTERQAAANVLIETSWNVKSTKHPIGLSSGLSINRNIVECKETTL